MSALSDLPVSYGRWREAYGLTAERDTSFTAPSGDPVKSLDTERDLPTNPDETLVLPGPPGVLHRGWGGRCAISIMR